MPEAATEVFEIWRTLSAIVHRARHTSQPASANELLRRFAETNPDSLVAPAVLLWAGDNLLIEARFRDAIAAYADVIARFPDRRFGRTPWAAIALEQTALCHEGLGQFDEAILVYRQLLDRYRETVSGAWIHYQIGRVLEEVR